MTADFVLDALMTAIWRRGTINAREWHGMKAHVGTDTNGLVHSLVTTHAGASEIKQLPKLLHGEERTLYGDQAYWSELLKVAAKQHGVRYRVSRRAKRGQRLTTHQRKLNRMRPVAGSPPRMNPAHSLRLAKLQGRLHVPFTRLVISTGHRAGGIVSRANRDVAIIGKVGTADSDVVQAIGGDIVN